MINKHPKNRKTKNQLTRTSYHFQLTSTPSFFFFNRLPDLVSQNQHKNRTQTSIKSPYSSVKSTLHKTTIINSQKRFPGFH
ncbi:hypothetical protein L6452_33494 [Arctium lappa]|uniref:Uncharacterized protein n=1 Tax=Arctium lappa TaxID=4217 RepID=A0ACB8YGH5_ARCLA|nr:hypothetical protein L6452_33494 [Arctium lappa]